MEDLLLSWKAAGLTIAAIVSIFLGIVKNLVEFNDGTLRRRKSEYLQHLRSEASSDANVTNLVDALRAEEAFKKIIGTYASPKLIEQIRELFETKQFSIRQIRAAAFYLYLDHNNQIRSNSGKAGAFIKWLAGGFIVLYALYTAVVIFTFLQKNNLSNLLAAGIFLLLFFLVGWYFGRDVREVIAADRLDKKILKLREG